MEASLAGLCVLFGASAVALALLLPLPFVPLPPARAEDADLPPGVVARVYGEDVTEAQLYDRLARRYEAGEKGKEVLDQIVDDACVTIEAQKRGVTVSAEEYAAQVSKVTKAVHDQSGGKKTLDDMLAESGTPATEFERTVRQYVLRQKMAAADLGGKPGEELPDHRLKLWVSSIKRKLGVTFKGLPDGVLAQIGDVTIDRQRFARDLAAQLPKEKVAGVRAELVLDAATRHAVAKAGVTVNDADVAAQIARLRKRFDGNPNVQASGITFDAFLKQQFGIGEADLKTDPNFRSRVGLEQMLGKDVGEAQVKKYWDDHRAEYGERAMIRQVFIPATGDASQFGGKGKMLSFREASEIALRARVAILEKSGQLANADPNAKKTPLPDVMTAVAKEFTVDPAERGAAGEPAVWTRQNVEGNAELETAVFSGELGQVVGPVRSSLGYHLLLVEERRPAPSYEECKDIVRSDLLRVAIRSFQMQLRGDDGIVFAKDRGD